MTTTIPTRNTEHHPFSTLTIEKRGMYSANVRVVGPGGTRTGIIVDSRELFEALTTEFGEAIYRRAEPPTARSGYRINNEAPHSPIRAAEFAHIESHDILSARLLNKHGQTETCLDMRVPGLMAMIRSQFNVLIVDKSTLPLMDAETATARLTTDGGRPPTDPWSLDDARTLALQLLAAVEYLEAHPPVDEQQVEALAAVLETATDWDTNQQRDSVARHLVQAGYTKTVQS